jgi:hypothetical protein
MKMNVTFFKLSFLVVFFLLFVTFIQFNTSSAETCGVNGPDGIWELLYTDVFNDSDNPPKHTGCPIAGSGTLVKSTAKSYTYELIAGNQKLRETFKPCGGFSWYACGGACYDHDKACAFYESRKPDWFRTWPTCIGDESLVETTHCGAEGCSPPNLHRCGEGAIAFTGIYIAFWPAAPYVTSRSLYQWVCNSCTTQYNSLVDTCGGGEIYNWNNQSCTGQCKPNCYDEYQDKIEECGGEMNILYFDYAKCDGICKDQNFGCNAY